MSQKVVLVTGGASGIGKATAEHLVKQGHKVIISGRRPEQGHQVAEELSAMAAEAGTGGSAEFVQNDVTDEAEVITMMEQIVARYGRLDAAVNNAGIANETKAIVDATSQAFKQMLDTNVLGLFYCLRTQIQLMKKQGSGAIVNVASIAGLNGMPFAGCYSATKHAVVGLTKSAALDHATDNIRINAVAPGAIKTEMTAAAAEMGAYDDDIAASIHPMQRMGQSPEIAAGIAWLLSDEASFVTGHILNIDGGFQAK